MLQGSGETAANHIAQNVEDHHVGVLEHMVLFEQLDGLPDDIATTAGTGGRAAGFDTFHAVEAVKDEVLGAQFLGMEIHLLENIDHRRHETASEREGTVVLGVAADLKHPLAQHRKRRRQVRGRRRFADPPLAIDRENLGALDLRAFVLMHLHRSFAVLSAQARGGSVQWAHEIRPSRGADGPFILLNKLPPEAPTVGCACRFIVPRSLRADLPRHPPRLAGRPASPRPGSSSFGRGLRAGGLPCGSMLSG